MPFESFEEILNYAIDKERQAADFYEEASKKERYSGAKGVFESFAEEEKKHQSLLENFSEENMAEYKIKKIPNLKRSDYLL